MARTGTASASLRSSHQDAASAWRTERALPEVVVASGRLADCTFLNADEVEVVVLPVAPGPEEEDGLEPRHGTIDAGVRYGIDLAELAERADFDGRAGQAHVIDLPRPQRAGTALPWAGLPERVVLLGLGRGSVGDMRKAGAALARRTRGRGRVLTTATGTDTPAHQRAFVEGYLLGAYRSPTQATGEPAPAPAEQLVLLGSHDEAAVEAAVLAARGTWLARDLTNAPANIANPAWIADVAARLGAEEGLEIEVRDVAALRRDGFGGILAVGSGSASEPRLVTVSYRPVDDAGAVVAGARHVVLVGKGITYDTGGIDVKPRTSMVTMKTDMAGAAVVLATVLGAARSRSPHRVTAVLPLAENHFDGASYRPADVLRLYDGTTVEVGNTDAEGRLVLADALAYAGTSLAPDVVVDVATLTGAAVQGLGPHHAALYASDDALAATLEASAGRTGERVWRMPLVADYESAVTSSAVADLRNVPVESVGGGSIVAALFLQHFAGEQPWAHLDIAGPSIAEKDKHEIPAGATGFGVRLLLDALDQL
ncbi:leucyl aminopeptidase family protein [Sanguibacter hominis]|uniref:leucyl aminopeptidase family protein n=1 Tax=Sanguibacter hominis TaxID=1312739 RepID=UPI001B353595|nr:leucyl aminopeptidase family protein [Sanguibacter hominis]